MDSNVLRSLVVPNSPISFEAHLRFTIRILCFFHRTSLAETITPAFFSSGTRITYFATISALSRTLPPPTIMLRDQS